MTAILSVGLFPEGRPNFRTPEDLKTSCTNVDPSYTSLTRLQFPEDYDDAQERCRQIARQLAERHPHENILLVRKQKLQLISLLHRYVRTHCTPVQFSNALALFCFAGSLAATLMSVVLRAKWLRCFSLLLCISAEATLLAMQVAHGLSVEYLVGCPCSLQCLCTATFGVINVLQVCGIGPHHVKAIVIHCAFNSIDRACYDLCTNACLGSAASPASVLLMGFGMTACMTM